MVENDTGEVAMRHWTSNGVNQIVGERVYCFRPQHNVCLAWVKEEDVAYLLSLRAKACCGSTPQKFRVANQNDVNVWEKGKY
jgi:hypothetical protein